MSDPARLPIAMKGSLPDLARGHMAGNVFEGRDDLTRDNYAALDFKRWLGPESKYLYRGTLAQWRTDAEPSLGANKPTTQPALAAAELVLAGAGASLRRDAVDRRVVADVRNRRGKLLDSQEEVGGWPALKSLPAPVDQDRDGIPDSWETAHGLNSNNAADGRSESDGDGYTNLEEYLNSLCPR